MEKIKKAVSAAEEDKVSRKLLVWLNTYPDLPVDLIRFEFLPADTTAMANSKSFTGLSLAIAWTNGCQRMKR